jgi:hypothetical protein
VAVWGLEEGDLRDLEGLRDFVPDAKTSAAQFADNCKALAARLLRNPNLLDFFTSNATAANQLALARTQISELDQTLAAVEDVAVRRKAKIDSLKADLNLTKTSLAMAQRLATAEPPAPVHAPDRSIKIPDPPVFSKGRKEYRSFKAKLRAKLTGDSRLFRDEAHQVTYAVGFLTDEAYETVRPLVDEIRTVAELMSHLDATYEDPDQQGTAERELRTLKQGTIDFSAHYAKFQGIMAVLRWEGSARHSALHNSLSQDLKETLARTIPQPDESFAQYVAKVKVLEDQLRRLTAESKGKAPAQSSGRAPRQSNYSPNPADSTGATPHKGPAPMDLSAQKRLEEKQANYTAWSAKGACTKCGSLDHWRRECPKNTTRRPLAASATADPADSSESSGPSGKD